MTILHKKLVGTAAFLAGDHSHLRELIHPRNDPVDVRYSLAHASVPPGSSTLPHALTQPEVYFFLSGTGSMTVEGEEITVEPGDTVYVPPRASQSVTNPGPDPLFFLCIVDPAWRAEEEVILS
jgi:mannose-6-phosphate isomerase-like protein (cupin superfamily)